MPLPTPGPSEAKDEFLDRCMGDEAMAGEYEDPDQRYAVCQSQWGKRARRTLYRASGLEFRAADAEARTATFVAATERAVDTIYGREVLRASGASLDRYRKNPVVLDGHDRRSARAVIGSATIKREGRQLVAEIRYAQTKRASEVWELVRDGHVRAVSIGYAVDEQRVKRLAAGEVDGRGESRVEGPALVVEGWELLELSQVPVPADEDAVRRSFYESAFKAKEAEQMKYPDKPAGSPATEPGPQPGDVSPEIKRLEERRREILAVAPTELRAEAERLLLGDLTAAQIRAELRGLLEQRHQPVGTPTPPPLAAAPKPATEPELTLESVRALFLGLEA